MDARTNAMIEDAIALIEGTLKLIGTSRVSLEQTNALLHGSRCVLASSRELLERTARER